MKSLVIALAAAVTVALAAHAGAQHNGHDHAMHKSLTGSTSAASAPQTTTSTRPACRKGAFLDPMATINASVRASQHLLKAGAVKVDVALAELDSILGIAIGQASVEYECVRGSLTLGYDKNFADTAQRAWQHAQQRKLAPVFVAQAKALHTEILMTGATSLPKK